MYNNKTVQYTILTDEIGCAVTRTQVVPMFIVIVNDFNIECYERYMKVYCYMRYTLPCQ